MSKEIPDDIETLADYDSEEEPTVEQGQAKTAASGKDTYVSVHASGFREFMLNKELERAITDCGFEHPSEVQERCIPEAITGTDVICQAKSGMGKTAVFVLSTLQQLHIDPEAEEYSGVQVVVLCHTRELAFQICHEYERFKKYMPQVKTAVFFGGIKLAENKKQLVEEPPHIVIGTPGRMLQLVEEKILDLSKVKHFVLDECDQMLEKLDMRRDVQRIFRSTPQQKQTMMFSATLSDEIRPVCKKFMHNPLEIYVNEGSKLTLEGLQQYYVKLEENEKSRKLVDLIDALEFNQLIIFVNGVSRAKALNKLLQECNFPSIATYGRLPQAERLELYRKFKDFHARIMVATNLLGRGIDIERVNVVINYDMADTADTYLHRVGRAGRFGTKGLAVSFINTEEDQATLQAVQDRFVVQVPEMPDSIDASTYMGA